MRRIVLAVVLLVAASFAQIDTLMTQNFNSNWSTQNPPLGWRIFHTRGAPNGNGDWDRDSGMAPWTGHPSAFAGIYPTVGRMDNPPDSLISPIIDCRGLMNVTLRCSSNFTNVGPNPYQAQLRYSIDSGRTFPYVAKDYYNLTTGTVYESLDLSHAMDSPGLQLSWVFYGDLWNIHNWWVDDVMVTGEHHPYTILLYQDFDTTWSTNNPPVGWRIYHTAPGDSERDDWHREVAHAYPWQDHPSAFPAFAPSLDPDLPPDSMVSPAINCAGFRNITLTCSTLFYYFSDLPYEAKLVYSTDNGATWPYVLHDYRFDHSTGPIYEYLKLPYAKGKPQVRLAWVYDSLSDRINWWSFDDVLVIGDSSPARDVACDSIVWPGYQVPPTAFRPSAIFKNVGDSTLTNIPVVCSLYRTPNVPQNRWTATIPTLRPDSEYQVTFSPSFSLPLGSYYVKVYSNLATDQARHNDTLVRYFQGSMLKELSYDDSIPSDIKAWPVGHNGWGAYFDADTFPVYIESLKVRLRTPGTASQCGYQLGVYLDDGAGHPGKLYYKTPVLYATSGMSAWNSVFVGGAGQQLVLPDGKFYVFYLQVGEPDECPFLEVDAARNPVASYWQYRSGVMAPDSTDGDYMIRAVVNITNITRPNVDLRTLYVDQPLYDFVQRPYDAPITPKARIENFGTQAAASINVECDIVGTVGGLYYTNIQTIGALAAGTDTLVTFADWTPTQAERCSVIVRVPTDPVPQNDEKRFAVDVLKGAHTGRSALGYDWIDSDTIGGPVYSWIDTTLFNHIQLGNSEVQVIQFEPGMHFPFYDSTYDYLMVSANGWVSLGQTSPGGTLDTIADTIPKPDVPNRCVYAWWDNLADGFEFGHGAIYYKWFGFTPNRYMVVTFLDVNRVGADTANGLSFQLVFHENGTIDVQYKDVECGNLNYDNARNATIGLENKLGTDGLCYLYARPPLSGGINPLSNRVKPGLAIKFYPERRDAAARTIIRPNVYEFPGSVTPQALIQNVGTVADSVRVFMYIGSSYSDNVLVPSLLPDSTATVSFAPWTAVAGPTTARCSVHMVDDVDPTNNYITKAVNFSSWARRADIPPTSRKRKVKSAAMAYATTTHKIYAMKGSGTSELWVYDPATDAWDSLASMPTGPSGKKPRDGVHFTFDPYYPNAAGPGCIWAIKGTSRPDFYYYDIARDTWIPRRSMVVTYRDWPYSNRTYRAPRRGASIVFAEDVGDSGSVYGMPGNRTNYFWRYDIDRDSWYYPHDSVYAQNNGVPYWQYVPLDIPGGAFNVRCTYGSDMVYLNGEVYVMKGTNTVEVFGFSPLRNAWSETLDMNSFYGLYPQKRVKAGGALTSLGDRLYALKGGNTQQFWHYNFASDSWKRNTDIPLATSGRRFKVKMGAALAAAESTLFALKGSNSYEFWEYSPGADTIPLFTSPEPTREGVMAGVSGLDLSRPWLTAYPNPSPLGLNVSYNITSAAPTRLRVYDAAGKVVANLWDAARSRGQYVTHWSGLGTNGKQVPAGIYFLKLESGDTRLTQKLVIQR